MSAIEAIALKTPARAGDSEGYGDLTPFDVNGTNFERNNRSASPF